MSKGRLGKFLIYLLMATAGLLSGCTTGEQNSETTNQRANTGASNATSASATSANPTPAGSANAQQPVTRNSDSAANVPAPQIGSGGDDLAIFAQTRSALGSEGNFANVIIDVKGGSVSLSGSVRSAAQKAAAARLAAKVKGVTTVNNNIQIAP